MLGRVISVGIVAFWLVMMSLLIRSELFHIAPLAYSVPLETVMQKMFEGEEPSDLTIYHQGNVVGSCSLQIKKDNTGSVPLYRVNSHLKLDFEVFGRSLRLNSSTDSYFDRRYQMTRFSSQTTTGDSKVEAAGDLESREVVVKFSLGNVEETHRIPFATLENMGPSGAMGLLGMGGLQLPSDGRLDPARSSLMAAMPSGRGPVTTVQEHRLMVEKEPLQTFLVHTTYDESVWSKVYVSPQGEILKVETSFGVTMLAAPLAATVNH
jgi:hypothetical protein